MSRKWTADEIPDQDGRVAIVTGANSGLGRITALELARHGALVVLRKCRAVPVSCAHGVPDGARLRRCSSAGRWGPDQVRRLALLPRDRVSFPEPDDR